MDERDNTSIDDPKCQARNMKPGHGHRGTKNNRTNPQSLRGIRRSFVSLIASNRKVKLDSQGCFEDQQLHGVQRSKHFPTENLPSVPQIMRLELDE